MLVMDAHRELTDDFRLSARSISEVDGLLLDLEKLVKSDRTIRFLGGRGLKKPTRAAILNALIYWLDAQPAAEQKRVIADGMQRLNAVLAAGQPAEAGAAPPSADGSTGRPLDPASGTPLEPPPGRRRKGSA